MKIINRRKPNTSQRPKVFMIPYDRNPYFLGRDGILSDLREKLQEIKPQWQYNHRVAIYGMGGVGKTQIAIEYVYRHEKDYRNIYWISASDEAALLSGFQEIGEKTGCLSTETDRSKPTEVAKKILSWLRRQDNWLLVIDNLDDVSVADGFLPAIDKTGHTLITTRNPDAKNIPAEGVEIPILGEDDSIQLLLRRSDIKEIDFPSYTGIAQEIVKELGHLALAIEHAGVFVRSLGDITKFLSIYRSSRRQVLRRNPAIKTAYPNSVEVTFLLSFERLKTISYGGQAAKLLELFVFLNPDEILIEFLRAGQGGLNDQLREIIHDELIFHESIGLLRQFSLIRRSEKKDGFSIHRLVQAVLRDQLSETELHLGWDNVIGICRAAFPQEWGIQESLEFWRNFQNQAVEPAFEAVKISSQNAVHTLSTIGLFLGYDGKLKDGERLCKRSCEVAGDYLGREHPATLGSMSALATIYWHQGRLQDASILQEKVLEARRRTQGDEHPDTLTSMNDLALTYSRLGRLQDASDLQEKVLREQSRTLGDEHRDTLTSMNNLALTYSDLGRLQDASDLQEKVLREWSRTLGDGHRDTLTSLNNLASTYFRLGRLQDASDLQEKVLREQSRTLGDEHRDTLTSMNDLANTYSRVGRLQDALHLVEMAVERRRRLLGEEHADTLTSLQSLATIYWAQERLLDASNLEERVLEARRRTQGDEHRDTLISMINLAVTYESQGRLAEASDLLQQALEKRKRILGEDHPDTVDLQARVGDFASRHRK
jgi:tetratricopeptide (TPR) repeat protein